MVLTMILECRTDADHNEVGQVTMKSAVCSVRIASAGLALLGCGGGALDPETVGKVRLYDPQEQEQMKTALSNAGIRIEVHDDADGNEEIWYDSGLQEQVLSILAKRVVGPATHSTRSRVRRVPG